MTKRAGADDDVRRMTTWVPLELHKQATEVRLQVGLTTPAFLELAVRHYLSQSGSQRQRIAAQLYESLRSRRPAKAGEGEA